MQLTINGKPCTLQEPVTIESLIRTRNIQPAGVAVLLNEEAARRETWSTRELSEGDRLELLTLAGGG